MTGNTSAVRRLTSSINTGNMADALNVRRIKRPKLSASDQRT